MNSLQCVVWKIWTWTLSLQDCLIKFTNWNVWLHQITAGHSNHAADASPLRRSPRGIQNKPCRATQAGNHTHDDVLAMMRSWKPFLDHGWNCSNEFIFHLSLLCALNFSWYEQDISSCLQQEGLLSFNPSGFQGPFAEGPGLCS